MNKKLTRDFFLAIAVGMMIADAVGTVASQQLFQVMAMSVAYIAIAIQKELITNWRWPSFIVVALTVATSALIFSYSTANNIIVLLLFTIALSLPEGQTKPQRQSDTGISSTDTDEKPKRLALSDDGELVEVNEEPQATTAR